ncbi:hypothetical protein F4556_000288 [Kitasatospora gansuensis]|uniref:DUF4328 domain-containing protein n=1 Tax=Kitasatospora gansuensis TaxID=258050 RepID=A0A7W7S7K6_9ACTN|nr:DUF4328 domain-containing protein [Kitasatospora gansuensis]MBB4944753.1 hypothetical protein [Kitasatospora gansuensis]
MSCNNCGRPGPVGAYCAYCTAPAISRRRVGGPATGITVLAVLALLLLAAAVVNRWWNGGQNSWDGESLLAGPSAREHGETLAAIGLGLVGAALLCGSAIGITFLVWLNRARHNLALIPGADPQWAPGWTVGAWFIPLGSFVLGPMVVGDVSRATYAGRPGRAPAGLLTFVWLLLWGPGLAAVGFGSVAEFNDADGFLPLALGGLAAAVVAIACLLGTVGSVTRVQRRLLGV